MTLLNPVPSTLTVMMNGSLWYPPSGSSVSTPLYAMNLPSGDQMSSPNVPKLRSRSMSTMCVTSEPSAFIV